MANDIPIGYRFRPTEEELISLLYHKVKNDLHETDDVKEKTLYGEHASPWQVFGNDNDVRWQIFDESGKNATTKRMVYVFTKLTRMSANKIARTAGSGTWDGETKKTPVQDVFTGEKIGSRRMLSYVLNSGSQAVKDSWIMHEYSLDGASLKGINSSHNADYVICRIIRDSRKYTKVKTSTKKQGKVAEEEVENRVSPQVLGKRKLNLEQENSQASEMITRNNNNIPEAQVMNEAEITTEASAPVGLPNYLVNYDGIIQQEVPSSYMGNCWFPPTNVIGMENSELTNCWSATTVGTENSEFMDSLGLGTSANQATTHEYLDNPQQSYQVQPCEPTSWSSVDGGDQMMMCQEGQAVNNEFSDLVMSWEDILNSIEGGNENIFGQLPLPSDEWFEEALPRI